MKPKIDSLFTKFFSSRWVWILVLGITLQLVGGQLKSFNSMGKLTEVSESAESPEPIENEEDNLNDLKPSDLKFTPSFVSLFDRKFDFFSPYEMNNDNILFSVAFPLHLPPPKV